MDIKPDEPQNEYDPKNYFDEQLQSGVGIAGSVLEIQVNPNLKNQLIHIVGLRLYELLTDDKSDMNEYGSKSSIEPDGHWVYIEERWLQAGFEFIRQGNTGVREGDPDFISLHIKSPEPKQNSTTIAININKKHIPSLEVTGVQERGFEEDELPYAKQVLDSGLMAEFHKKFQEKLSKEGEIKGVVIKAKDIDGILRVTHARVSIITKTGDGELFREDLKFEDGKYYYGSKIVDEVAIMDSVRFELLKS